MLALLWKEASGEQSNPGERDVCSARGKGVRRLSCGMWVAMFRSRSARWCNSAARTAIKITKHSRRKGD